MAELAVLRYSNRQPERGLMALRTLTLAMLIALTALLAGCASDIALRIANPEIEAAVPQGATVHRILVATTRERDTDPSILFNGEREGELGFAAIDVSVPPIHKTGQTERPSQGKFDPKKHFVAQQVTMLPDMGEFMRRLPDGTGNRHDVMVFVHGYRTNFADALFRITQIVHDTKFEGTAVLFTWASRGKTVDYIYDRDSATAARDALEATLLAIEASRPNRIDVIAHSMGSWVTMEALRQLKIAGKERLGGHLGDVILASPDIAADVFIAQMKRFGKPATPFFVMLSRDDRALRVSQLIAGNKPRLGDYTNNQELADLGVIVVDLTAVGDADSYNHAKFAQNPTLVTLLGERLRQGESFTPQTINAGAGLQTVGVGVTTVLENTARIIITTPQRVFQTAIPQ